MATLANSISWDTDNDGFDFSFCLVKRYFFQFLHPCLIIAIVFEVLSKMCLILSYSEGKLIIGKLKSLIMFIRKIWKKQRKNSFSQFSKGISEVYVLNSGVDFFRIKPWFLIIVVSHGPFWSKCGCICTSQMLCFLWWWELKQSFWSLWAKLASCVSCDKERTFRQQKSGKTAWQKSLT
mgnify:CR=1 FL=1